MFNSVCVVCTREMELFQPIIRNPPEENAELFCCFPTVHQSPFKSYEKLQKATSSRRENKFSSSAAPECAVAGRRLSLSATVAAFLHLPEHRVGWSTALCVCELALIHIVMFIQGISEQPDYHRRFTMAAKIRIEKNPRHYTSSNWDLDGITVQLREWTNTQKKVLFQHLELKSRCFWR